MVAPAAGLPPQRGIRLVLAKESVTERKQAL